MADVTPLGNGRYLVSDGTRQSIAYAAGPASSRWVFLGGRVYLVETPGRGPSVRRRTGDDELALSSPMPATVAAVNAKPGQDVTGGDVLIMLEAMKMELPIKAPRNGRVKSISCRKGDLVQPGVPLVDLEPEPNPVPNPEPEHEPSTENPEA